MFVWLFPLHLVAAIIYSAIPRFLKFPTCSSDINNQSCNSSQETNFTKTGSHRLSLYRNYLTNRHCTTHTQNKRREKAEAKTGKRRRRGRNRWKESKALGQVRSFRSYLFTIFSRSSNLMRNWSWLQLLNMQNYINSFQPKFLNISAFKTSFLSSFWHELFINTAILNLTVTLVSSNRLQSNVNSHKQIVYQYL